MSYDWTNYFYNDRGLTGKFIETRNIEAPDQFGVWKAWQENKRLGGNNKYGKCTILVSNNWKNWKTKQKQKTPTDTHNTNKQTKEALDASSVNNL